MMEEHVSEMSNMTCVLREMNVLNSRNNIDIAAMKADTENYNVSAQLLCVGMCAMYAALTHHLHIDANTTASSSTQPYRAAQ